MFVREALQNTLAPFWSGSSRRSDSTFSSEHLHLTILRDQLLVPRIRIFAVLCENLCALRERFSAVNPLNAKGAKGEDAKSVKTQSHAKILLTLVPIELVENENNVGCSEAPNRYS